MTILPKHIHRFSAILVKTPNCPLCRNRQADPKYVWNYEWPRTARTILKQKNEIEGLTFPNFQTYYKVSKIETYFTTWRQCGAGIRINIYMNVTELRTQGKKTNIYAQMTFSKCAKTIQQVVLGSLDIHMHSHVKEWSLTPYFRAYNKINSKWIKKKICINVCEYGLGNSLTLTTQ